MRETDYKNFAELLSNEAQFYPSTATLTATKIRGYFESLGRFELSAIKQILVRLRERCEFFPTIRAIVEQAEGSTTERAEIAWHTFYSLLSEGQYPSLWLYDKAMAYAIETLGGWMTIVDESREASIEMLANFEKRFKAAYKVGSDRGSSLEPRIHWAGLYEANNRQSLSSLAGWSDRSGAKTVKIQVCVVSTDKYRRLEIPFDVGTMQIEAGAQAALEAGGQELKTYLPDPPRALPQLPSGDGGEPITESEKQQILAQIRGLIKPMPAAEAIDEPAESEVSTQVFGN